VFINSATCIDFHIYIIYLVQTRFVIVHSRSSIFVRTFINTITVMLVNCTCSALDWKITPAVSERELHHQGTSVYQSRGDETDQVL